MAHNTSALQPVNGPMGGSQEVVADNLLSSITLLIIICLFHFILVKCLLLFMIYSISVTFYIYIGCVNDNLYYFMSS
jgi:hypothetical protein